MNQDTFMLNVFDHYVSDTAINHFFLLNTFQYWKLSCQTFKNNIYLTGSSENRESREHLSREQFIREQLQNRDQSMDQEPLRSPMKESTLLQNSSGQTILSNTLSVSQQSNQQNSHQTLENGSPTNPTRTTGRTT